MATEDSKAAGDDAVSATHPQYDERVGEWARMRDTARGATAVARGLEAYLPMPDGFRMQDDVGARMYGAYLARARFPEIVSPTVVGMVGTVCRIDAKIELPKALEYLRENVDGKGTTLTNFYRKVVEEVVTTGGRVLLADAPSGEGGQPYVVGYPTEALINWSEDRDFFVLSETRLVRKQFIWEVRPAWRVLRYQENESTKQSEVTVELYDEHKTLVLPTGAEVDTVDGEGLVGEGATPVRARGNKALDAVPLVRVGARDLDLEPDNPPLLGVASSAIAIYQLDADYRHQLFMSGQETLFGKGISPDQRPTAVGAGIAFFAENPEAELKYVSPSCKGIEAHKAAIADERENAAALGARMLDSSQKAGVESGDALRIRRGSAVATLITIGQTTAEGVETVLRHVARMLGENPDEVVVTPNLSYVDATLTPKDALALVQVWQSGAISYPTLHANLQRGEIASYDVSAADEREMIETEQPADPSGQPITGRQSLKPDYGEGAGAAGAPGTPPAQGGGPQPVPQEGENPPPDDDELSKTFDPSLLS